MEKDLSPPFWCLVLKPGESRFLLEEQREGVCLWNRSEKHEGLRYGGLCRWEEAILNRKHCGTLLMS